LAGDAVFVTIIFAMTVDDDTTSSAEAELDLGYPRSRAAKLLMAFGVVVTLVVGIALTKSGLGLLLGDWDGLSTLVSMYSFVLLTGLGGVAVAIRGGRLSARFYTSRLIANADGIRLGGRGRRAYRWSQIARFETDTHPKSGDAFGAIVLSDGRRIQLHALLEESGIDGNQRPGHTVEVCDRIRTLNGLLAASRDVP
jgi:hypothetical protein